MWPTAIPWLQALIGGLLGAIIGGIIAGRYSKKGSIEGSRLAADRADELFHKEREARKTEQREEIYRYLCVELKLNQSTLQQSQTWGLHRLSLEAWHATRGNLEFFSSNARDVLLRVYAETQGYNDLFEIALAQTTRAAAPNVNVEGRRERLLDLITQTLASLKCDTS